MARLLVARGQAPADPLAVYLRDVLPTEYTVVSEPLVQGEEFRAIVVGPRGLFVLHDRELLAEPGGPQRAPWWRRWRLARRARRSTLAARQGRARRAMRAFMEDEFPALYPVVRELVVSVSEPAAPPALGREALAAAITSGRPRPRGIPLDEDLRETLALALRDRQLTASQRAKGPFIFRSGGFFRSGRKVWTIRRAIAHMDRAPEDGIYHLHNGTLEKWLAEQGAHHLAALARTVTQRHETDPRVTLENFLLGSGLVPRPRLAARPRRVNLGYVLSGQTATARLRVQKGRGRGYLFGAVQSSDPWLRVEPGELQGKPLEAIVTADTAELPIGERPQQAEIRVLSSASAELSAIPVSLRVMARPSPLNRALLRPLAGLLLMGLLGAGLGWALWALGFSTGMGWAAGAAATAAPIAPAIFGSVIEGLFQRVLGTLHSFRQGAAFWPAVVGLFWGILGILHGLRQGPAWPLRYALGRLLLRTFAWAGTLVLLAVAMLWGLGQLNAAWEESLPGNMRLSLLLLAFALAILPAAVGEIQAGRAPTVERGPRRKRRTPSPAVWAAGGIVLVLALVVGARVLPPTWQQADVGGLTQSVQAWAGVQWAGLERGVNGVVDGLTLRYYDRRAPTEPQAATEAPAAGAPTAQPTSSPKP